MRNIDKKCKSYLGWSVFIIALISIIAYLLEVMEMVDGLSVPIVVSAVFSLVVEMADVLVWRRLAMRSPETLTTFYTAVSGFRMLLALATMFVYYLFAGRAGTMTFVVVFLCFYLVLLAHHAIFFSRLSNDSGKLKK